MKEWLKFVNNLNLKVSDRLWRSLIEADTRLTPHLNTYFLKYKHFKILTLSS
jgi:hypothetical protein